MAEYIEREAIVAELAKGTIISDDLYGMGIMAGVDYAMKKVVNAPAADVAPVVHGEWRWAEDGHCKCTVCGQYATVKRVVIKTNFCPNCGAKMDGERKGDD